jgi:hypothetical protein
MIFSKNRKITIDLISFSLKYISTGQIGCYIIEFLYKELGFKHIGYQIENINGDTRCTLITLKANKVPIQYFKDRCSGMIEEKVKTMKPIPHKFNKWQNGFEEVAVEEKFVLNKEISEFKGKPV